MSNFVFYKMDDKAAGRFELSGLTLPVRPEMTEEVFRGGSADLTLILDELELFLKEHQEYEPNYRDAFGRLAYFVGTQLGAEGYHQMALHYFESALARVPENLSLRVNYAIALYSLGRNDEALQQLEMVIDDADVETSPLIWALAARLYAQKGDYFRSYQLLQDCTKYLPGGENYWYFLSDMKEKAGLKEPVDESVIAQLLAEAKALEEEEAKKPAETAIICSKCQAPLPPGAKFCKQCGTPVKKAEAPAQDACVKCGAHLKPGVKFCPSCGNVAQKAGAAGPQPNVCYKCGNPVKEGAKFCNHCGTPQH